MRESGGACPCFPLPPEADPMAMWSPAGVGCRRAWSTSCMVVFMLLAFDVPIALMLGWSIGALPDVLATTPRSSSMRSI